MLKYNDVLRPMSFNKLMILTLDTLHEYHVIDISIALLTDIVVIVFTLVPPEDFYRNRPDYEVRKYRIRIPIKLDNEDDMAASVVVHIKNMKPELYKEFPYAV